MKQLTFCDPPTVWLHHLWVGGHRLLSVYVLRMMLVSKSSPLCRRTCRNIELTENTISCHRKHNQLPHMSTDLSHMCSVSFPLFCHVQHHKQREITDIHIVCIALCTLNIYHSRPVWLIEDYRILCTLLSTRYSHDDCQEPLVATFTG